MVLPWANLFGAAVVMLARRPEFTSIWCFQTAVLSVILYFFFGTTRTIRPFN
jgi:hypothetical protein